MNYCRAVNKRFLSGTALTGDVGRKPAASAVPLTKTAPFSERGFPASNIMVEGVSLQSAANQWDARLLQET